MRRRGNTPTAMAALEAINPQLHLTERVTNPPGIVEHPAIMRPEVRHNRDKRWCWSLLPFGKPQSSMQISGAFTHSAVRRFGVINT
jgi:hypothetical protein